jgi:hypothetical protein
MNGTQLSSRVRAAAPHRVAAVAGKDWLAWHDPYDRADSERSRRLAAVRHRVRLDLDGSPPGPLRVISLCAGQGRDRDARLALA